MRTVNKNMQAVKSSGSKIEKSLGKALWMRGLRYRKNHPGVFGRPDFVFMTLKIAVFADSEFWHGRNWRRRKFDHKSNQQFWFRKIEGNIKRDRLVNRTLKESGWIVLRFWGKEIEKDVDACADRVVESIKVRRASIQTNANASIK